MKHKNQEMLFTLGVSLVGVSIVFLTSINKSIGFAFLVMGIMYMIIGIKSNKNKKK